MPPINAFQCPYCKDVIATYDTLQALDPVYMKGIIRELIGHTFTYHLGVYLAESISANVEEGNKEALRIFAQHFDIMNKVLEARGHRYVLKYGQPIEHAALLRVN